jgi:hypothetical protein
MTEKVELEFDTASDVKYFRELLGEMANTYQEQDDDNAADLLRAAQVQLPK